MLAFLPTGELRKVPGDGQGMCWHPHPPAGGGVPADSQCFPGEDQSQEQAAWVLAQVLMFGQTAELS